MKRRDVIRHLLAQGCATEHGGVAACGPGDLASDQEVLLDAMLTAAGLEVRCDALTRVKAPSGLGAFSYEPVKIIDAERVGWADVIGLAFLGHVLGLVQDRPPAAGIIVRSGGRSIRVAPKRRG